MRTVLRTATLACLTAVLVIPAAPAAAKPCPGAQTVPSSATLSAARTATLCLLNNQRSARGLRALHANRRLELAATRHSADMVRRDFFAHDAPGGIGLVSRLRRVGGYIQPATSWAVGENIAWGSGSYGAPSAIVASWMRSPGHRANVLSRAFREIGIGIAVGAPADTGRLDAATYTTDFGRR